MSWQDIEIVNRARTIQRYPVSRDALIKTLELESVPSERIGGSVRMGNVVFKETWTLPNSTQVSAWDWYYVGDVPITPTKIDSLLNNRRKPKKNAEIHGDFIELFGKPTGMVPRKSFKSLGVVSGRGESLYESQQH